MPTNSELKNEPRTLVIYHSIDDDGFYSAAIVKMAYEQGKLKGRPVWIPYNRNRLDISLYLSRFNVVEVVLVDISLPPADMLTLLHKEEQGELTNVWIDHHESSIDDSKHHGYDTMPGIRFDNGGKEAKDKRAACEGAWAYYMNDGVVVERNTLPEPLMHAASYDVWDRTPLTDEFNSGSRNHRSLFMTDRKTGEDVARSNHKAYDVLNGYINGDPSLFNTIMYDGKVIERYRRTQFYISSRRAMMGSYKGASIMLTNVYGTGSRALEAITTPRDIDMIYSFDGFHQEWKCGAYARTEAGRNVLLDLARQYGGGGHRDACGFKIKQRDHITQFFQSLGCHSEYLEIDHDYV